MVGMDGERVSGGGPCRGAAVIGMVMVLGGVGPAVAGEVAPVAPPPDAMVMPELRPRFGIEAGYYWQQQPYEVSSLRVSSPGFPLPPVGGDDVTAIDNEVDEYHLKFDWDVLPFLNLFALVGAVDGSTEVRTALPPLSRLDIEYDGWVYGLGASLMYGTERWFVSLTSAYTLTDLDVTNSEKEVFVVMPRVGMIFGGLSVWVGAMYESVDEEHSGTIQVSGLAPVPLPVSFDVDLEQEEAWNFLVGVNYAFNEHWNATLEGGFGDRESVLVGLQWRF